MVVVVESPSMSPKLPVQWLHYTVVSISIVCRKRISRLLWSAELEMRELRSNKSTAKSLSNDQAENFHAEYGLAFPFFSSSSQVREGISHFGQREWERKWLTCLPLLPYDKVKGAGLNSKSGLVISSLVEKRLFIVCFRVDRLKPLSSWLFGSTGFTIRILDIVSIDEGFSSPLKIGSNPRS